MAIVVRGLGLPEDGALVAGGLGVSESNPGAITATLSGSSSLTATLTAGDATPPPVPSGNGGSHGARLYRRKPTAISARLVGSSSLRADLSFVANFDDSDIELLLMLELV